MNAEGTKRKLSAILSADVKGYSRLMSQDERGTIRTLTAYKEAMSNLIQEYKGRVVDSPGDNLLAEFGSVVDAANCAVEIQRELAERNAELPPARQMEFRIGINLGDIVEEEGRIYGDGVNIAARVESLAGGGGICISGTAYDQIENRLGLEYEYLGEQEVKNIEKPVRVYRVLSLPGAADHRVVKAKSGLKRQWRKIALAVVVVLLILGGGFLGWNFYQQRSTDSMVAAFAKEAALPLPETPSIAVLAFENLSGDPEQEYFSDGLSENIITRLVRLHNLFVIARNSSFVYKGKPVDARQVGRELGVRYVLEGSVQKTGERIRINAQLIDAATGKHLWADSYDRELKDVFSVMDEITQRILTELAVKLTFGEGARYFFVTNNFAAFDLLMQGARYWLRFEKESNQRAKQLLAQAIELDPNFTRAMALLGFAHLSDTLFGGKDRKKSFQLAGQWAQRALAIDDTDGLAYTLLGRIYTIQRKYEKAIAAGERALEVEPGRAHNYSALALTMLYAGKSEEALVLIKKAMRLSPYYDETMLHVAGMVHFFAGRFEEGIPIYKEGVRRAKGVVSDNSQRLLIASYMKLGREDEARAEAKKLLQRNPKYSLKRTSNYFKRVFKDPAMVNPFIEALRKAGLPD